SVRADYLTAAEAGDKDARKWAFQSEAGVRIRELVGLSREQPGIPLLPGQLDVDDFLLNTPTGTVDLRTGELRAHRREDLLTKLTGVGYDTDATCPTWDAFLERIFEPRPSLIGYLQKVVGYSLTGSIVEQA